MSKPKVKIFELIHDQDLADKEDLVTDALCKFDPSCGRVHLYRTRDGRIGFEVENLFDLPTDQTRLNSIYRLVIQTLKSAGVQVKR